MTLVRIPESGEPAPGHADVPGHRQPELSAEFPATVAARSLSEPHPDPAQPGSWGLPSIPLQVRRTDLPGRIKHLGCQDRAGPSFGSKRRIPRLKPKCMSPLPSPRDDTSIYAAILGRRLQPGDKVASAHRLKSPPMSRRLPLTAEAVPFKAQTAIWAFRPPIGAQRKGKLRDGD
jgi:hypothetical protein